jgi:predicted methyltransferase
MVQVELTAAEVVFPCGRNLAWSLAEKIADQEKRIFRVNGGALVPVQVFSESTGWLRTLCATSTAPTTLVSGIPMHRIKDTDPLADTRSKIVALNVSGGRILDTATGLGYSAIAASKMARDVVTIELDSAAIDLARENPWSDELFERQNIKQIIGDSFDEVLNLEVGSFSGIIHDPPTLSLGGTLYSEEFYRRLYRLMKRGGRLFHYIGDPRSALGKRTFPGVTRRLQSVGFKKIAIEEAAYGVSASI